MHVDDVAVATASACTKCACVHVQKLFCGGVKKVCGQPFKMRSVGIVETGTFLGVALETFSFNT